jgi:two-component SAPR family response regulator
MKKILIIDDEKWWTDIFSIVLKENKLQAAICHDPYEAIDVIEKIKPDCILLDFFLPYANAAGLINEISSHHDLREIPIILCSSSELSDKIINPQVKATLHKPSLTPEIFIDVIKEVLA